ncbi:C-terminal binding protein [Neobacillus mesonae]|uniref:C-terminal binding protein n=1 Tax=Neobacillus mesonae TaxID=1193713 RepID=UPI00083181D3|nr:C-terminal binding protein [Neobacillus mesonae]
MKNGKRLVWILDDEWTDHSIEKALYEKNGFDVKVTRSENFVEDFPNYAPYAEAVVAQVGFQCTAEIIDKLDSCKIISASAVGFNHIDVEAATKKGILVSHVPEYCSEEVSDHAVTHILTLSRRFPAYNEQVKRGEWDPMDTLPIKRFSNNTVGLLGFGRIARKAAQKLKGFGVRLIAHDPYVSKEVFDKYSVEGVSFYDLLNQSTFLTLHVPLNPDTKNIIGYEQLKMMPQGAFVINTSRGGVINEEDLYRAIQEGHIGGAGLDVLLNEPPHLDDPLLNTDKVYVTPHSAYISEEAIVELKTKTSQNAIDGVTGKPIAHLLNPKVLKAVKI